MGNPVRLPTRALPWFRYAVTLDGVALILSLRWLERPERWSLDILASDGAPLRTGRLVVCGTDLLRDVPGRPPGRLMAIRDADPQEPPDIAWTSCGLYYGAP